jgi:predicted ATPase
MRLTRILSETQRTIIQVASVIGKLFSLDLVKYVITNLDSHANLHSFETDVQFIIAQGLFVVYRDAQRNNSLHYFRCMIIQETVYKIVDPTKRSKMHALIANWYEKNSPKQHYRMGHHWQCADHKEKARDQYELAGNEAMNQYAVREAIEFYTLAFGLLEKKHRDVPEMKWRIAHWETQLGTAYLNLGHLDKVYPL